MDNASVVRQMAVALYIRKPCNINYMAVCVCFFSPSSQHMQKRSGTNKSVKRIWRRRKKKRIRIKRNFYFVNDYKLVPISFSPWSHACVVCGWFFVLFPLFLSPPLALSLLVPLPSFIIVLVVWLPLKMKWARINFGCCETQTSHFCVLTFLSIFVHFICIFLFANDWTFLIKVMRSWICGHTTCSDDFCRKIDLLLIVLCGGDRQVTHPICWRPKWKFVHG